MVGGQWVPMVSADGAPSPGGDMGGGAVLPPGEDLVGGGDDVWYGAVDDQGRTFPNYRPPALPPPTSPGAPTRDGFAFPRFRPTPFERPADFEAPAPFSYAEFAYDAFRPDLGPLELTPFQAPTLEDAAREPGYAFARDEGLRAMTNSAAARGLLRTGGTLKELLGWGNRFAEQNYHNVYNRAADTHDRNVGQTLQARQQRFGELADTYDRNRANAFGTYTANRANAADAYTTNYNIARDTWSGNVANRQGAYDRTFAAEQAAFNPEFRGAELTFEDLYRRWATDKDDAYKRWRDQLDAMTRLATLPPME
ncbi:MAG TPA: hypothetical protein VEC57_15070 [Candidatus Limnocylindrales bacterium]|nr:hypothetical protein [Candidatus Limnocylindrales bacterium]